MPRTSVRVIAMAVVVGWSAGTAAEETSPADLFDQRIMPIFRSPEPSSCVQCHLASVDLKNYILPSHEKTFVSLRDQGLIDLEHPEKSKILTLIRMGDKDLDEGARLIHEKTREAEIEAFASWVKACCDDPKLTSLPPIDEADLARPEKPNEVIRHARKSRIVDSFVRNVWSQRMRCFPCHTPFEIDSDNPRHQAAIKNLKKFESQYSEDVVARTRIFKETPEDTVRYLIEQSRNTPEGELPLINLDDPTKSLLVLKPLSKLPPKDADGKLTVPSRTSPMAHMGGLKMHPNDQSYKSFIAWMQDYANTVGGRYTSVEDLPADNWFGSKLVLRLTAAPEAWKVGMPVQLFVHSWDEQQGRYKDEAIAFTQGTVTPKRFVNGMLFLLASDEKHPSVEWDRENAMLPGGKYLVKAYVDSGSRLEDDPTLFLDDDDFAGEVELKKSRWRAGFRGAAAVSGRKLKTPGT